MNYRELLEADFSDRHDKALDAIGAAAKNAFGKFKSAAAKAKGEIHADNVKAAKAAEDEAKAKEHADKEAAAAAKKAKSEKLGAKMGAKSAPISISGLILDRTPSAEDLPELDDLDAEHFAYAQNALDAVQHRFDKFSRDLGKRIRATNFIDALDKDEVDERLGDQSPRMIEASEEMLMQNQYGERNAWMQALTNDDTAVGAKALIGVLAAVNKAHVEKNKAAMTEQHGKKNFAEGLNLVNMIGAQRQVIEMRIGLMREALATLSQKPVSEALLKRVGKLAKRL